MSRIYLALLGVAVLLLLSAPSMAQETTKKYTVKEGDTLWDISNKEYTDPFLWPKLWKENPQVVNPDRIYPGNILTIPEKSALEGKKPASSGKAAALSEEGKAIKKGDADKEVVLEAKKIPLADKSLLASVGYIIPAGMDKNEIVGSPDKRVMVAQGDTAYSTLSKGMKIGDRFTVLRIVKNVTHPKTEVSMGNLVKVLGDLKITAINEQTATAEIITSYDYIENGDKLIPYTEIEIPMISAGKVSSPAGINGYVVETMDKRVANAQMDIVYLDKGSKDGLKPGDTFKVLLAGDRAIVPSTKADIQLPNQVIGELQILSLQEGSSTAQIVKSTKDAKRGDMIQSL